MFLLCIFRPRWVFARVKVWESLVKDAKKLWRPQPREEEEVWVSSCRAFRENSMLIGVMNQRYIKEIIIMNLF